MSGWDKPLETKESNAWTTFANEERNSSNSHQSAGHGQGFQNSNRGRSRGRGGNFFGRPQQRSNQYPNNHSQQNTNQYNRWNNQQESNRKPTNDNSWGSTRNDNKHTNNTNEDNGWNNASSSQVINNSTQEQGWRNNNDSSSWSNNNDAKTSRKHWDNNNSQANEWSSTSKGNTRSSPAAKKQQWNNDSNGWGNSTNSVSNSWGNKTEASTADNANSASGGWGNNKSETQKPTTAAPNNWSSTATTTAASSGGWSSVASKKPAANNWSSQSANSSTTDTNQWSQESTPPSTDEQPSSGGGGWDEKPKSKDVQWGAISLDDLGWNESKQKTSLEPCQGIWKDGVHVLGEDNEKVRLKLFGTLEDKENVHSGINFDKYDNIPVETKGENIPDGIHEFASSGLDKHLLENIEMAHYKVPTPVQKHSIPIVMNGHDLMACAQTGSGKTAGFLFPILSALFSKGPLEDPKEPPIKKGYQFYKKSYPQALILAPTRELASQIFKEAKKFCYRSYVRPCVAYGGADISAQLRLIDRGCHILVATPGRLVDILERRRISFKNIQYLILDEADRMLDMGFEPQVRRIVEGEDMPPPTKRQTLMFSATFPDNIQVLARDFLSTYVFLSVGRVGGTSDNITQEIKWVKEEEKKNLLIETLEGKNGRQGLTLIFTQTKRMADSVCRFLNDRNYPATAIHGDRIQSEREAALQSFKQGITPIMVATAVAARGLDIPNVTHVISFDLPQDIDDYVHRIGRTGRAGNTGYATTFFSSSDKFLAAPLVKLLKDANQDVPGWLDEISREARSF